MPKKIAVVDYARCHPERCDHGVCRAALECEYRSLVQLSSYQAPEINPARWCRGCADCVRACPLDAIRML